MSRVIVIASGKGGVGKTSLAINLATALHRLGKDVTLIDANLTTPNLGIHLGVYEVPYTLHDVLEGKISLKKATYLHPIGFKVIPSSLNVSRLSRKMRKELLHVLSEAMHKSEFVILDAAPGLGSEARLALQAGDEVIIVTNPEMPAMVDALKTMKLAKRHNAKIIGVVLNRITGYDEMSPRNAAHFLDTEIIGLIPEDHKMKHALRRREPIVAMYPYGRTTKEFMKLAKKLCGIDIEEEPTLWQAFKEFLGL